MILPSSQLLRLVAPHFSPELVSPAVIDAIAGFAEGLPCAFTWGLIELRLAPDDPRADFMVCAAGWEGSREALAEAFAGSISPERERAMFGALGPMLRAWAAGGGRFADIVHLFLEYDDAALGRRPPFVFLSTDPDARRFPASRSCQSDAAVAIAREGLTLALGELDVPAFTTWERQGSLRCSRESWVIRRWSTRPRGRDRSLTSRSPCTIPSHMNSENRLLVEQSRSLGEIGNESWSACGTCVRSDSTPPSGRSLAGSPLLAQTAAQDDAA